MKIDYYSSLFMLKLSVYSSVWGKYPAESGKAVYVILAVL